MPVESLLTTPQLAEWMNVKPSTIRKWQRERKIPFRKIGGSIRYVPTEIHAWIAAQSMPAISDSEAIRMLEE